MQYPKYPASETVPAVDEAAAPIYGDYRKANLQSADNNVDCAAWESSESVKMKEQKDG